MKIATDRVIKQSVKVNSLVDDKQSTQNINKEPKK